MSLITSLIILGSTHFDLEPKSRKLSFSHHRGFTTRKTVPFIHRVDGWVDPRVNLNVLKKRKITYLCRELNLGQSSSHPSCPVIPVVPQGCDRTLRYYLLCPCCTVLAVQAGGDTHSKMAPTTGTHSILVPGTKTVHFDFNYLSSYNYVLCHSVQSS